jgi:hypothetical protein
MHPTTARYLVGAHQSDLYAEAARERLARQVRDSTRRQRPEPARTRLVAVTRRRLVSLFATA